jgi:signal transduction histidine kinase
MRMRAWQGYLAIGTVIAAAYFALPSARIVLWAALGVSAAAATAVGVRWQQPSTRLAWWLLAAGELTFVAGDVVNDLLRRGGGEVSFPSLADLAYLATYPLLVTGLLLLIRRRSAGRDLASMLDALAITTAASMLSWLFLITPYIRDPELTVLQRATSVGYPLGDLLLVAVVARLAVGGGTRRPAFWLVTFGAVGTLAADALFGLLLLTGTWQRGGPVDLGWVVFYLCWGAAALHPSMATLSEPAPVGEARLTHGRLALLASVSLVAPAVLVVQWLRENPIDAPVIAGASVVLFLVALARMRDLASQVAAQLERRRATNRIIRAAEDERVRIAGDLHDGPVQELTALRYTVSRGLLQLDRLGPDAMQPMREMLTSIGDGLQAEVGNLRRTMAALRPPALEERGLHAALSELLTSAAEQAGFRAELNADVAGALDPAIEMVLYRITQEAVRNVAKHAQASEVQASLQGHNGTVSLRIRDNGRGFDPIVAARVTQLTDDGHFGLAGMRDRVTGVGGDWRLTSRPGGGTTIEVDLPRNLPLAT